MMNRKQAIIDAQKRYLNIKNKVVVLWSKDGRLGLKGSLMHISIDTHCKFCEFAYIVSSWDLKPDEIDLDLSHTEYSG